MKNKGKKDKKGKEIKFSPNIELLELESRDWKTWLMNDLVRNPNKYRKQR
jgi:hypothetical protein